MGANCNGDGTLSRETRDASGVGESVLGGRPRGGGRKADGEEVALTGTAETLLGCLGILSNPSRGRWWPVCKRGRLGRSWDFGEEERALGEEERTLGEEDRTLGEEEMALGEDEMARGEDEMARGEEEEEEESEAGGSSFLNRCGNIIL
jgi:hypothetical protein